MPRCDMRETLRSMLLLCGAISAVSVTALIAQVEEITVETEAGPHAMVFVPAGEFVMGYIRTLVTLDAYYIDKFEVSNALYGAFVEATGNRPSSSARNPDFNGPTQPVKGVYWYEASDYCGWVGLRLPTEAEWEKAAGGDDGRWYPWGMEPSTPEAPRANWGKIVWEFNTQVITGDDSDGYFWTAPVGSYPEGISPYGVYNMAGNLMEWVFDWYAPLSPEPQTNPTGPPTGRDRVSKGGGYGSFYFPRTITRRGTPPPDEHLILGFRCAQSADALPTAIPSIGWGAVKAGLLRAP